MSNAPRKTRARARGGAPNDRAARDGALNPDILPGLLGYRVRRAQVAVFNDFMASFGGDGTPMTPGQFGLMALIGANPGVSQSRLARAVGVDRSTIVSALVRLEDAGWIVRAPSPTDRRALAVSLTGAGRAALARAKRRVRRHEARIAKGLSAAERDTLMRLLARISPAGAAGKG